MKPLTLHKRIRGDQELARLELEGFERGERKGKTLNVTLGTTMAGLDQQYMDLRGAYLDFITHRRSVDIQEMKRCIADLRNQGGCVFLKIQEIEQQMTKDTLETAGLTEDIEQ